MSETTSINAQENTQENTQDAGTMTEARKPMDPMEAAERIAKGVFKLARPIRDGEVVHEELHYDFNAMSTWEIGKALDSGMSIDDLAAGLTNTQAIALFAAAAAKSTKGLDATDIKERMSGMDGIAAMRIAKVFFKGCLLGGSLRIMKES